MKPYLSAPEFDLWHGDCIEVMRTLPDNSVDSVVTDPPYGLEFMGKSWDKLQTAQWRGEREKWQDGLVENHIAHRLAKGPRYGNEPGAMQEWHSNWATEALRVLKPGGHLLAFGGTRTAHRLACAIEDAGFDIRDSIAWMYGSGFPKSLDVSKAIDKAAGAEREVVGGYKGASNIGKGSTNSYITQEAGRATDVIITAPATDAAKQWQGWGTALKPAFEPIVVARKPLIGTVAENVLAHGTGALNIDGCRIGTTDDLSFKNTEPVTTNDIYGKGLGVSSGRSAELAGRWPANVILDESQAAELDRQSGVTTSQGGRIGKKDVSNVDFGLAGRYEKGDPGFGDIGGASRFFYTAKANSSERPNVDGSAHPTVKLLDLMRYLVRLVTPPGGVVLEPFGGSGTTIEACVIEGFRCIAIDLTEEYLTLIAQRLTKPIQVALL